jgi:NAD(P)-dependent dehydrogenase (short-subunit alcohol dehydrogenase family)
MKSVIITGASSGIGEAASIHLAKKGWRVFAGVRKNLDGDKLRSYGIFPVLMDVTKESTLRDALEQIKSDMQNSDELSLVNNAGIAIGGPIEAVPIEKWKEQFEVNFFGLIQCTQIFLPLIRKSKGKIINMSSVSGLAAIPYLGPYAASKFAVEAVSDFLRREIQKFGCKVIVIEPGPIKTPIWNKSMSSRTELVGNISKDLLPVYEQDLESFLKMVNRSAENAVSVEKVSLVIEKALKQKNPKTRYVVGDSSISLQTRLLPFLPDRWLDKMIASQF